MRSIPKFALLTTLLALGLAACNLGAPTQSSVDELTTAVALTLEARASATQPPATDTEAPTAAPTATSAPSATSLPTATRVNFATGATQNVVTGQINGGSTRYFVAGAAEGQLAIISADTPAHDATLSIFGADGTVLLAAATGADHWQGVLPSSQDYYFGVSSPSNQNFTLNVIIAAPVQFASGQDQATYTGVTADGYAVTYFAYAFEDQDLHVTVDTDPNDAALTVYGFTDGQPYARAQNGVVDFSLNLPSTQYYIIEVVPQGGRKIDYELSIEIN